MTSSEPAPARKDHIPLRLAPVTSPDIPALVTLHTAAFQTDQFSNLMLHGRDNQAHQTRMTASLEAWLCDPAAQLVQALDSETGHVLGWACWIRKGGDDDDDDDDDDKTGAVVEEPDPPARDHQQQASTAIAKAEEPAPVAAASPAQELAGRMHMAMVRREAEHMKAATAAGGVYMVLQALATDPTFQQRGVGSRLVRWGLERADAAGLPCWIHASDTAHRLYESIGFRVVGLDAYDLDAWAPAGSGTLGQPWGLYTFRYMVRPGKGKGT